MPTYSVDGQDSSIAADSIIHTERGASKRHKWLYLTAGSAATPADQAVGLEVNRVTGGAPAGTSVTPEPTDIVDGASVTTCLAALTTEPTKAETLLRPSFNLRANYQWYANPGREFVAPDTADNGLVLECVIATASQLYEASVLFEE